MGCPKRKPEKLFELSEGFGVHSMELSPKGDFLIAGSGDGVIRVWDLHDDENVKELQSPRFAVNSLAFSPDGRYIVAAGMDGVAEYTNGARGRNRSC